VGESANFILIPMLIKALEQLLSWDVEKIQWYTKELFTPFIGRFKALGCTLEEEQFRCNHLIGIKLPETMAKGRLQKTLEKRQIFVSQRAEYMRIAMHVYNTSDDLEALIECIESVA
jgi:selenocysteine lyase/cysteine desulfurase